MSTAKIKTICFDIGGTILECGSTEHTVPLMPELVRSLYDRGWRCLFVTGRERTSAARSLERILRRKVGDAVITSSDKGATVKSILAECGTEDSVVFVDNAPRHLHSACALGDERVTAIGFAGGLSNAVELGQACAELGIGLALSAVDLAEALECPLTSPAKVSPEAWVRLIPGLSHPASAICGETWVFDHRAPLAALSRREKWWLLAWPRIGWIGCEECLWKIFSRSVIEAAGMDAHKVLGDAYKAREYLEALREASPALLGDLEPHCREAVEAVINGVEGFGAVAAVGRAKLGSWEACRMSGIFTPLRVLYGDADWLVEADRRWSRLAPCRRTTWCDGESACN